MSKPIIPMYSPVLQRVAVTHCVVVSHSAPKDAEHHSLQRTRHPPHSTSAVAVQPEVAGRGEHQPVVLAFTCAAADSGNRATRQSSGTSAWNWASSGTTGATKVVPATSASAAANASVTNSRGGVDEPDNPVAMTTIVVSEAGS